MKNRSVVRSVEDLRSVVTPETTVVTLFSGGLDSSFLLHLLQERRCARVIALCVDVGQELDAAVLGRTAARFGAELRVVDRRTAFAHDFVVPAIAAHATYLGLYPISASLSRPLMARCALEASDDAGASVILHTANQSQNSLRRLNGAFEQLGFRGAFGSPYELDAISRPQKMAALEPYGIDPALAERTLSGDANLWCREFESGALDDPEGFRAPEHLYRWSRATERVPQQITIAFESGVPAALNGDAVPVVELVHRLNHVVGSYGLGRYAGLEHLGGGEKVLEVREMPAAALLLQAYRQLETACVSAETIREKIGLEQLWVREAVEGRWFGDLRIAAQLFVQHVASRVSGTITFVLSANGMEPVSIIARDPLYIRDRDAWERDAAREAVRRTEVQLT